MTRRDESQVRPAGGPPAIFSNSDETKRSLIESMGRDLQASLRPPKLHLMSFANDDELLMAKKEEDSPTQVRRRESGDTLHRATGRLPQPLAREKF